VANHTAVRCEDLCGTMGVNDKDRWIVHTSCILYLIVTSPLIARSIAITVMILREWQRRFERGWKLVTLSRRRP
jgi:hypothetical protein